MDVTIAQKACSLTHAPLYTIIDAESDHHTQHFTLTTHNFKRSDWNTLMTLLSLISWGNLNNISTVNDALSHIYDIVYPVLVTK